MTIHTCDLPCYDGRKSFYGKARITEYEDNGGTVYRLTSYSTDICEWNNHSKTLVKLSPVATATTRRHIRSFLRYVSIPDMNSREWDALPLRTDITLKGVDIA